MNHRLLRTLILIAWSCLLLIVTNGSAETTHAQSIAGTQRSILFDEDWRFHRGGAQGAEASEFDDSQWRRLDLPHDWSIEDLPGTQSPFDVNAISQVSGGFTTGGTGWYRKTFSMRNQLNGKRVVMQFDGIYMNAEVWLNGQWVAAHPYGYTSFHIDLTDKIKFGGTNVIAVKVKNEGENSRWYSGSGIYRHVWLLIMDQVHVAPWGAYFSTPEASSTAARVTAKTQVVNASPANAQVSLTTRVVDESGREVAKAESTEAVAAKGEYIFGQQLTITAPKLWSPDSPSLYHAVSELYRDGQLTDRVETEFGVRTFSFDVVHGFLLNGKELKLKGGCLHHDNGPLGARAFDRAEERRVELLKASGFNALRLAHNPPSPAFLRACDRLGILVIDEAFDMWREGKNPHDYHLFFDEWWKRDIESMIYRDRNHPSIIMWSIGNEIPNRQRPEVVQVGQQLADYVHQLDATRPVTSAVNDLREDKDPYFKVLDVAGYNYAVGGDQKRSLYEFDHQRVPGRIMFASESYPLEAFRSWMEVVDHPYVVGDFVWTAFDYIGEASIGWRGYFQEQSFYPWTLAYCGDIDVCGWKRPQSYYRDALWKGDQLSIFVKPPKPSFPVNSKRQPWSKWHWDDVVASWNWEGNENTPLEVKIYSSCEEVELFLNGRTLGRKTVGRATAFTADWTVPYQAGVLKVIGYRGGKQVNASELQTANRPTQIKLQPDRTRILADGQDLSYVTVELVDGRGIRDPNSDSALTFAIDGPGSIAGVGNANPQSTESFQGRNRRAWNGRALVIIKAAKTAGIVTLTASAKGLAPARIVINTTAN